MDDVVWILLGVVAFTLSAQTTSQESASGDVSVDLGAGDIFTPPVTDTTPWDQTDASTYDPESGGGIVVGLGENFIDSWASAIQQHEGWSPGSTSYRNNNPGNLKYVGQRGSTGADSRGFAVFPDYATGLDALKRQLRKYVADHPGYSLLQMMTLYLGGNPSDPQRTGEGDPFAYASAVADAIGTGISSTLGELYG